MVKPVNSENAAPGADFGVSVPMPGVPGDAMLPEAARVPLRELMVTGCWTRRWSGPGTRPAGCG